MKGTLVPVVFSFLLAGCSDTSEKIDEANLAIRENSKHTKEIQSNDRKAVDLDGPYPADEYSLKPTGKFYFQALYASGKDSTWVTIEAKSEEEIEKKYPELEAFKIRPNKISYSYWFKIRQECLKQNRVFDLNDAPRGWLLENEQKLK